MRGLSFAKNKGESIKALFLGAHSDDIEIGCGGTVLYLLKQGYEVEVWWVVFSANPERRAEAEKSAALFLSGAIKKQIVVRDFKESFFPYVASEIKAYFEELKRTINPDLVFTHFREDLHQDHRLISELTWNTFRNHLIFEYEIVKYDGDLANPNVFVHLSEELCSQKLEYLIDNFHSQQSHPWFTEDAFRAILRLRGAQSNALSRYAEGFYVRKLILD